MSEYVSALVVILKEDLKTEEAEALATAIAQFRHVSRVELHAENIAEMVSYGRARTEIAEKLWDVLFPRVAK